MKKSSFKPTHIVVSKHSKDPHNFELGEKVFNTGIKSTDRFDYKNKKRESWWVESQNLIEIGSDEHLLMKEIVKRAPKN